MKIPFPIKIAATTLFFHCRNLFYILTGAHDIFTNNPLIPLDRDKPINYDLK